MRPHVACKVNNVILLMFLINSVINEDHLPFGRVAGFSAALGTFTILVNWIGLLDMFLGFKELHDTLWYCHTTEVALVLLVWLNE